MQRSTGSTPHSRSVSTDEIAKEIHADARRELNFIPSPLAPPCPGSPQVILFTGATGFLGAFVLHDLLIKTEVTRIVCLVRCPSDSGAALRRLHDNLARFELMIPLNAWSRVEAITGDISAPKLGLEDAIYSRLSAEVDTVIHCAASVNFYQSYGQLRSANVESAWQILRFAVHRRTKRMHYMSSTGVFDSDASRGIEVSETDAPTHCRGSVMGYTETKWVAEQLMLQARARGLPTSIYRAPFIMGDSRGIVSRENLIVTMLLGAIQGGAWPVDDFTVPLVPVDALSHALVYLSTDADSAGASEDVGHTYHIMSPQPITWRGIGEAIRQQGYPVELLSYDDWKHRLRDIASDKHNALRPLVHFFTVAPRRLALPVPEMFIRPPRPLLSTEATETALAPAGLVPPRMSAKLMGVYLDYFFAQGWLPPVPSTSALINEEAEDSLPPFVAGTANA